MPFVLRSFCHCSGSLFRFSRQSLILIAFGVISLELCYQGVSLAFTCPDQPKQISKDFEGEVNIEVGKLGPVSGGELKTKAKQITRDLLEKAPDRDRVYLEQMMYASYCTSLQDNKALSPSEITQNIRDYNAVVRGTVKTSRPASVPSPLKRPGKEKKMGTQFPVTPPVLPLPQAETKQPEAITCALPLVGLTTKPKIFVPEWIPFLNTLREEKIVHDFHTLMQVRGRQWVKYGGGQEEVRQANFTVDCLEKNGYLKTETLDPPSMIGGEFKNRKIIFLKPIPMLTILE